MSTPADVAQAVKSALALSIPDLDTTIGSITGKLVDAFAVPAAAQTLDAHLRKYQYDIDSMSAGTLEAFVRLFGMNRRPARYAIGTVTFGRSATAAAAGIASIPVGTRVMSNTNPVIYVQTSGSAIMSINQTTVDVPVQAVVPGASGNIAAGTLTLLADDVEGVGSATTNTSAMYYGSDAETDSVLRERWKTQVFRSMAGTEQMYRAVSFEAESAVSSVNVLGPKKTWADRVTVAAGTTGALSFGNPEYIYPGGVFFGADLGSNLLLSPRTDYVVTINNSVSPATIKIDAVSGGLLADGDYDISFNYVPTYSRNNPFGTRFNSTAYVNNRVDVWTDGSDPVIVHQDCKFSSVSTNRFGTADPTSALYYKKFQTLNGANPSNNDVFTPLGYGPIISIPNSMTIGGTAYVEGTHYDIVHRSDAFGFTPTSPAGIIWYAAGPIPTTGVAFSLDYIYNQVPAIIQRNVEARFRLLGTDVQYHAGIARKYRFHVAVAYLRGYDHSAVNADINLAVANLLGPLGFDSALQVSDVLQAIHNVTGVDNVRFLNSSDDSVHYAIEQIRQDGTAFPTPRISQIGGRAADIYFDDATFPQFQDCRIVVKTRTNFGAS